MCLMRLLAYLISLAFLSGCALAPPKTYTEIRYSGFWGFKFFDGKDNDIVVDELSVDPATRVGVIRGLKIRNNASDPMTAYVGIMQMQIEYNKVQLEKLQAVTELLAKAVEKIPSVPP